MKKQNEAPKMWSGYRRIKLRLIILALGWMPFGVLLLEISSLNRRLESITFLMIAYWVYLIVTMLQYLSYRCPNCDVSLFGRQLYRRTCPGCGILINK